MKALKSSKDGASPHREVILQNLQVGIGVSLLYAALILGGQQEVGQLHASDQTEVGYGVVDGALVPKPNSNQSLADHNFQDGDSDGWFDYEDPYPFDSSNNSTFWVGLRVELMGNRIEIPGRFYPTNQFQDFGSGIPNEYQFDSSWTMANSIFRDQRARISYPEYGTIYQGQHDFVTTVTVWGNYWYIDGVEVPLHGVVRGSFEDNDQDGIPNENDPYPDDPSNATPGYYWQGGFYSTFNGSLYIGARWLPYSAVDSDGDGFPDVVDPGSVVWLADYSEFESYGGASDSSIPFWDPDSSNDGNFDWDDSASSDSYYWDAYDPWQDPSWFYDSDGDGLYDWEDPYPHDPNNGWSAYPDTAYDWGNSYNTDYDYSSTDLTMDSDGDGVPDSHDPYPYDFWNGQWQDPYDEWSWFQEDYGNSFEEWESSYAEDAQGFYSGFFHIDGEEQYLSGYCPVDAWSDVDSDGIPDADDPYPYDSWNNSYFWMGGTFEINHEWVTLNPTWLKLQENVDTDMDGIPDKLDAYPLSAANTAPLIQQRWEGHFVIDGNLSALSGFYFEGQFMDYDADGLPDWADPYPFDSLNNSRFYSGEHWVDGAWLLISGYYRHNEAKDSDFDGIPDVLDPYPYFSSNSAEEESFFTVGGEQEYSYTGEYRIDGVLTQFYGSSALGMYLDTDGDGLPDEVDPYPEDLENNSYRWPGGYFSINGTLTYIPSHWFAKDSEEGFHDQDSDGIPDAVDPYPYSSENHATPAQAWSGYFYVDGHEVFLAGTYRVWLDTDGDSIPDTHDPYPLDRTNNSTYFDVAFPQSPDSDGDGIPDSVENLLGLNPYDLADAFGDLDGDALPNGWEYLNGLNPLDPNDAYLDWDGDNLANLEEYLQGTDPRVRNAANPNGQTAANQDASNTGSHGNSSSSIAGIIGGPSFNSGGSSGNASPTGSSSSASPSTTPDLDPDTAGEDSTSSADANAGPDLASEHNSLAEEDTWFLSVRKKSVSFTGHAFPGRNEMRPVNERVIETNRRLVGGPQWYILNPDYQKPSSALDPNSNIQDDGFNGDADLENRTLDEGDPRDIWDPAEFVKQSQGQNPMYIPVEENNPTEPKFLFDNTRYEEYDSYESQPEEEGDFVEVWVPAYQKGIYTASNVYSGTHKREVTHTTTSSTLNWKDMNATLEKVSFITPEAHKAPYASAPEKQGWMGDGVLGLRSHTVSSHAKTIPNPNSGQSEVSAYKEHLQFQLNRNTAVEADAPDLAISVLVLETVQKLSQVHVEPIVKKHALLRATLHKGKVAERWEVVSGTLPESVSLNHSILDVRAPDVGDKESGEIHVIPIEMIAFKRGRVGQVTERAKPGIYGVQAVLMENADRDEQNEELRDCDTDTLSPDDDDLVRIVIKMRLDSKLSSLGLSLTHQGIVLDGQKKKLDEALKVSGPSLVNFYDRERNRLKPEDLKVEPKSNSSKGKLGKLLQEGEVEIYLEGASLFGSVPTLKNAARKAEYIGGALLQLQLQTGSGTTIIDGPSMLVLRGGFFRYLQRENVPGRLETLEFRDGIGRITYQECDLGDVVHSWTAKSGIPSGANYNVRRGNGHAPPGWRYIYMRPDYTKGQKNYKSGSNIIQGSYCRWLQDDYPPTYKEDYIYHGSWKLDREIGEPEIHEHASGEGQTIMFKYQIEVLPGGNTYNRTEIQIHPDGKKNGTGGCIGIQSYDDCKRVYEYLKDFNYMKILVELY